MKFHEIPIGQQFEFEGEVYVKTAPLVASHMANSKQKFMPRYAPVMLAGAVVPAAPVQKGGTVRIEAVGSAFDDFYAFCLSVLEKLPAEKQGAARDEFEQARKVFLDSLH